MIHNYSMIFLLLFLTNISQITSYNTYNICVGSTGLLFSYSMGALSYLKSQSKIQNIDYHLIGTSGGSWCSLIYHLEDDISDHGVLWNNYIGERDKKIRLLNRNDMKGLQKSMENGIKFRHRNKNISDIPLSIITTKLVDKIYPKNVIINKFDDIDDIINYSICSSYIPYICGNKYHIQYKNELFVDGHIFRDRKLIDHCHLHLDKKTWGRKYRFRDGFVLDYDISKKLFENGWNDAMKNLTTIIKK